MPHELQTMVIESTEQLLRARSRREFLRLMTLGGTLILLPGALVACGDDGGDNPTAPGVKSATLDLAGDTGILNYLYALEQLEAAFYIRAIQDSTAAGFNAIERRLIQDIRNHEVVHRESLRALLGAARLPDLRIDGSFGGTNFRSRASVLETARIFEDLGVAAYNNAGRHLTSATNLLLAAKIVSVEARHSAIVRDLIDDTSGNEGRLFAGDDIVDENGLDNSGQPDTVVGVVNAAKPYFDSTITVLNSPA